MTHNIRAITLDLDNTLWDIFPTLRIAEQNSYQYLSQHYPRIVARYSVDDIPELREQIYTNNQHLRHDVTEIRRQLYIHLLAQCDYDTADAEQLLVRFIVDRNKVEFYPDVLPALKALAQSYPLVALSDGNADLEAIGIQDLFVGGVFAGDIGVAKPDSKGFLKSCEIAGVAPSETLHIGDHPIADIFGARQAGLQAMWIQRDEQQWSEQFTPDYSITSLAQAVELLC